MESKMIIEVYIERDSPGRIYYVFPELIGNNGGMVTYMSTDDVNIHLARYLVSGVVVRSSLGIRFRSSFMLNSVFNCTLDTVRTMRLQNMINKVKKEFDKSDLIWYDKLRGRIK